MLEQQLVDYIKKAKEAGQSDEQTRALLYKNGWTEAEVSEAFSIASQKQPQPQAQPQQQPQQQQEYKPRPQPQAQVAAQQPQVQPQPQAQPQQQPQYQPQTSAANTRGAFYSRRSFSILKFLIVLIILIVVIGAGYFVAGQYLNLPWNPFKPSPETIVNKMMANMENVKIAHTETQVGIDIVDASGSNKGELSFNIGGGSDATDVNNVKSNFTVTIDFKISGSDNVSDSASLSADIIGIRNNLYLKLNSIEMPSKYSYPGLDIAQAVGKWFKFDQDSINALSEVETGSEGTVFNSSLANNSALIQIIKSALAAGNIFSNYTQLSDEVVSSQKTYHYSATISKDNLKNLINEIITAGMQGVASGQESQSNGSNSLVFNMAQTFVNAFVGAIGDTNIEMWIGQKDNLLYQAKIDKTIDLDKIFPGANKQLKITFNETNSDFERPITVQEPENAQKIEDILLPLLKTQKIKSDMNQVGSVAQSVFSATNSYKTVCINNLLNGYLKMGLLGLSNDMISQGAKKPVCLSGIQDFCVSTQLSDGSYICIDKNNIIGTTGCVSYRTVCK